MDLLSFSGIAASISLLVVGIRYKDLEGWALQDLSPLAVVSIAGEIFWILAVVLLSEEGFKNCWSFHLCLAVVGSSIIAVLTLGFVVRLSKKCARFPSQDGVTKNFHPPSNKTY